MKKLVLILLLPVLANAGEVRVKWMNPTTNTDGSALDPEDITRTRIEYGTCNGEAFGDLLGEVIREGNYQGVRVGKLEAGTTYCFRGYTKTTEESEASNVVSMVATGDEPTVVTPPPTTTVKKPSPPKLRKTQ